jgi:hypothetical protein
MMNSINPMASSLILAVIFSCLPLAAGPKSSADKSVSGITEISLERNCFGCPTGSVLVLRKNGTATYTVTGSARHGTADQTTQGRVPKKEFAHLAQLAAAQGFFTLAEEYGDPQQQDGKWTSITIVRAGQSKKVLSRDQAGPKNLQKLVTAIEAVRASIGLGSGSEP